jgi:1,4-dihydroxy-6-naphthoate synthase
MSSRARWIVEAVRAGEVDAGIVIHEAQLTFADAGLHLVVDLGAWWHAETGLPLPLGANAIRRDLDARFGPGTMVRVAGVLRDSIAYAKAHRADGLAIAGGFAQPGTTADQADRFVAMYVNDLTLDAGDRGERAVAELMRRAADAGLVPRGVDAAMVG